MKDETVLAILKAQTAALSDKLEAAIASGRTTSGYYCAPVPFYLADEILFALRAAYAN